MRVITAPEPLLLSTIDFNDGVMFLAGSIEMGTAQNWQDRVISDLNDTDIVILNPDARNGIR